MWTVLVGALLFYPPSPILVPPRFSLNSHFKSGDPTRILTVLDHQDILSRSLVFPSNPLRRHDIHIAQVENVDFSEPVVAEMSRTHSAARPKMTWRVMDVTDMSG